MTPLSRDTADAAAAVFLAGGLNTWTVEAVTASLDAGAIGAIAEKRRGAALWRRLGEASVSNTAEVLAIAVAPHARRRGLGRALLSNIESQLGAGAEIFLEVSATNEPAIALYDASGFTIVGQRPTYYADGADALVMRKTVFPDGAS